MAATRGRRSGIPVGKFRGAAMQQNVREEITNRIITALEAGTPPWRQGWVSMAAHFNASTKKPYQGINQILLGMSGFSDARRR